MASMARRLVVFDDNEPVGVDYEAVAVAVRPTILERRKALTASQKIRRRHRAWMFLVDKGLATYREIADGYHCPVQTIYYGVEQARKRELKIQQMASRYGL